MIDHDIFPAYEISTRVTHGSVIETDVKKITGLTSREVQDSVAVEEPLEIQLGYGPGDSRQTKSISVTMRSPGNDFDLAAGFLMTEGVVHDANDIERIAYALPHAETTESNTKIATANPVRQNIVRVELATDVPVSIANLQRNFYNIELWHMRQSLSPRLANSLPAASGEQLQDRRQCALQTARLPSRSSGGIPSHRWFTRRRSF